MKTSKRNHLPTHHQRTGAAAVEFAIVAPIFVTLIFGVAEMGRALDVSTNMTAALREGGRLASMHHNGLVPPGMTTEEKVLLDIRTKTKWLFIIKASKIFAVVSSFHYHSKLVYL